MNQTPFPHNEEIITTSLEGLIAARDEFTHLTGCDDWSFWLNHPEYMIGSCIMRHTKQTLPNVRIWPEVAPKYVSTATDIRQGRIDIVYDDINDNPRVVVEVKANVGLEKDFETKGAKEVIERLCALFQSPIDPALLRLGLFAFIANRNDTSLSATLATMEEKVIAIAHSFGMTLKSYSKKNQRDDCEVGCVCSGVYAIEPVGV